MSDEDGLPRPGLAPGARQWPLAPDPEWTHVTRDGRQWRLGAPEDVAWITSATSADSTIVSAIPAVFARYATVVLPGEDDDQQEHDDALLAVLREHTRDQPWWLGYLDTGADDIVFPDAPVVMLYSQWPYVLVEAGPNQAATWREDDLRSFWAGRLPNLMFPADRTWLVSTLWDDDWTCVGGPGALVDDLARHPVLRPRVRRVSISEDATPPGHHAG